jgi:hypothetical protein
MNGRLGGAAAGVVLRGVLVATVAAAAGAALFLSSSGSRSSEAPSPKRPASRVPRGAATSAPQPLPALTFSPRSSLARLDLRTGAVQPVDVGTFFSVADPSLSPAGALAFVGSDCASCAQELELVSGGKAKSLGPAASIAWLDRSTLLASVGQGEETDIMLVGSNGRTRELDWLADDAEEMGLEKKTQLVVSPDRRLLLFSGEGNSEHHGNYVAQLRSRRLLPLVGEAADAPTFSPDGRTIAYQQVSRAGDWDVCRSRISNGAFGPGHCYRSPAGNDREPAFLRGGHAVAFVSDRAARRSGVSSLYRLDLRTGSVRRLTPPGYDVGSPAVTPVGHSVLFVRRALVPLR